MLKSINIQNFKSYKNTTLELAPLTLMIGANASGKTNAIEALRLINWVIRSGKTDNIKHIFDDGTMRGTVSSLYRNIKQEIEFGINCSDNKETKATFNFKLKNTSNDYHITSENLYLDSNLIYASSINEAQDESSKYMQLSTLKDSPIEVDIPLEALSLNFYPFLFEIFENKKASFPESYLRTSKEVETNLQNIVFLDSLPCNMREYVDKADNKLTYDGSNISAVIYKLCNDKKKNEESKNKKALLDFIKSLPEQNISDITFIETNPNSENTETSNDDVMVQLVETFGNNKKPMAASLLSDGTLRVLAIGALLLSAPEGTLLVIEEIDNGVHPSRINNLLQQIQEIATDRKLQVLITSHNPALLDAMPNSSLEDVVCCYRDKEEGDSRLVRLGDMHKYPELIAQGTLGELVTNEAVKLDDGRYFGLMKLTDEEFSTFLRLGQVNERTIIY